MEGEKKKKTPTGSFQWSMVMCVPCVSTAHMVLEHSITDYAAVLKPFGFLTPIYEPIAIAIAHFVRFGSSGSPLACCDCRGETLNPESAVVFSHHQTLYSTCMHGTLPLYSFASCLPLSCLLLSVFTYVLVHRGIYAEGEYSTKTRTHAK